METGRRELSLDDLAQVTGGVELTPEARDFMATLMRYYRDKGYTREEFIADAHKWEMEEDLLAIYLDIWDNL